jgi:hypothetical protein
VINVLKKFEEKEYHSPIDISKEVGKVSKWTLKVSEGWHH